MVLCEKLTDSDRGLLEQLAAFSVPELCDGAEVFRACLLYTSPSPRDQRVFSCAYWGDHRSYCARFQKAAGVVIDGAFRDLEGCEEVGFPVFARGLACGSAQKTGRGQINVPVSCGGVPVNPGDIIVGDVNGVCVIRPGEAGGVLTRAAKKAEAQRRTVQEMERTGKLITKILI